MVVRLVNAARVFHLEMLSACTPVAPKSDRPLTGSVCGVRGREVVATGNSVATIESDLQRILSRNDGLFGAVVEYTDCDGKRVPISSIMPGDN